MLRFLKRGVKGQITVFVILGIVIIIFAALFYILLSNRAPGDQQSAELINPEFKPTSNTVEACMHSIALDGIEKMGSHGGYVDPLDKFLAGVSLKYDVAHPHRSDLVSLTGSPEYLVPYYLEIPGEADSSNYYYETAMPSLESMQYQLARYIDASLPSCLADLSVLTEQGFIVDNSNYYNSSVAIKDDYIDVTLTHPIVFSRQNSQTTISKYKTIVRFPFLKYYELAQAITFAQHATQFSESFSLALINYHSGLAFDRLPPFVASSNEPYSISWNENKVRLDIDGLLISYIPALQAAGTRDFIPIPDSETGITDIENAFFQSLSMNIFNETLPNTSISFIYPANSLNLKIQPKTGSTLKPSISMRGGSKFIPSDKSSTYRFFYDLSFPIIVEIRGQETGYELSDFSFLFAFESNLIENKPALAWQLGYGTQDWSPAYLNISMQSNMQLLEPGGNMVNLNLRNPSHSLMCREEGWLSGNITINIQDGEGNPLQGADVYYGCGDYDSCYVGESILENSGAAAWHGKIPLCVGGYFSISKEDYNSKKITYSSDVEGRSDWLPAQKLNKITKIKVIVKKRHIMENIFRAENWTWIAQNATIGPIQDINPAHEQVIININEVGNFVGDDPIAASAVFGKDGQEIAELELAQGEYQVEASFLDHNGLTIPAECGRYCTDRGFLGFGCSEYEYYPKPEQILNPMLWGGLEFNQNAGSTFHITKNDINSGKSLIFYVIQLPDLSLSTPTGGCVDNLNELDKISKYSLDFKSELAPEFI